MEVFIYILINVLFQSGGLHHDSAFKTLFLKLTRKFMRIMYISCINIIIRITAAAAIKFCPALFTFRFCINMRPLQIRLSYQG